MASCRTSHSTWRSLGFYSHYYNEFSHTFLYVTYLSRISGHLRLKGLKGSGEVTPHDKGVLLCRWKCARIDAVDGCTTELLIPIGCTLENHLRKTVMLIWMCTPAIPTLGWWWQEDQKFIILRSIERSALRSAWAKWDPISKRKKDQRSENSYLALLFLTTGTGPSSDIVY